MNDRDANRLRLLDRIAERVPELDLDREQVEWIQLPDGVEALAVNGGGLDGGDGTHFVNYGDDVHAYGSLDPLVPGHVGCIVIRPTAAGISAARCPTRWRRRSRASCPAARQGPAEPCWARPMRVRFGEVEIATSGGCHGWC